MCGECRTTVACYGTCFHGEGECGIGIKIPVECQFNCYLCIADTVYIVRFKSDTINTGYRYGTSNGVTRVFISSTLSVSPHFHLDNGAAVEAVTGWLSLPLGASDSCDEEGGAVKRVASVNGAAVEATNDSVPPVTGICAVNAEPP